MTEREGDRARLDRMEALVNQFEAGDLGLGELIGELEELHYAMRGLPADWGGPFRGALEKLQSVREARLGRAQGWRPAASAEREGRERALVAVALEDARRLLRRAREVLAETA